MTFGERKKQLRSDPEKARAWQQRSRERAAVKARETPRTPLPVQSKKRRSERRTRADVVAAALARDGGCVARLLVPEIECGGPLDPDERCPRSVYPGGELDLENVQTLCRRHHDWKHAHRPEAELLGLYQSSWTRRTS